MPSHASILSKLTEFLDRTGHRGIAPSALLAAPRSFVGEALFRDPQELAPFSAQMAMGLGCIPYSFNDVAYLSLEQIVELYLRESYPPIPATALAPGQDSLICEADDESDFLVEDVSEIPICFVLGSGRSGTTIFRAMLNMHDEIWAPGELHFAQFRTLSERAYSLAPEILRYMPIPEIADQLGVSPDEAARRFRAWEFEDRGVASVLQELHRANPARLIIDKTPPYSGSPKVLNRIHRLFPNARFIHLARHPFDVIRSLVRIQLYKGSRGDAPLGLNPYQVSEMIWSDHTQNIATFLEGIPNTRKLRVHYEALVSAPKECLVDVCQFLGLSFDRRMAAPYEHATGGIAQGAGDMNVHRFRKIENRPAAKPFYPLGDRCQRLALQLGYPKLGSA